MSDNAKFLDFFRVTPGSTNDMKWDYNLFKCTEYVYFKYSPHENQIK